MSTNLNRRTLLLGAAAATTALRAATPPAADPNQRLYPLNHNWTFRRSRTAAEESVTLPHANVTLPWHSFPDRAFQFVSFYKRRFKAPQTWQNKRVFLDFDGAMTATKVTFNGHTFPEYKGGYTPFSFELTPHLALGADNQIDVELDSTERPDIPPFGNNIDYLTFGGIYRDVRLRVVPKGYLENVHAKPVNPTEPNRSVAVRCFLNGANGGTLTVELRKGTQTLKTASATFTGNPESQDLTLVDLPAIDLWDLAHPNLYDIHVELKNADGSADRTHTRIGFRDARFTPAGFLLNGQHVKLRGLNRHQTFPFVGGAMPARAQRQDALILKRDLKLNLVRTSHYPQATSFLDACDELGLLVLEEIPGWQYIGDKPWQDIAVRNVGEMIRRDWNHPSIILWGVRINESQDNHDFYTRTNAAAHSLDDARQTGGIRYLYDSEILEDVFTMNDFGFPLRQPNHPLYLNTEFSGHMFSTKRFDNVTRIAEHVHRHARVHNQLAGDDRYAGGIGWCAFDYNTHENFGSGDHICYHGVSDIFRIPKPAAFVYKSQCDPAQEIVLEPGFYWSSGDKSEAGGVGEVPICSNCDHLKLYLKGKLHSELDPDRAKYPNLKYPLFTAVIKDLPLDPWGDLKIEGYLKGKLVKTVTLSGTGVDADLKVEPDDTKLEADGRDCTRVVLRITDEYGNIRPYSTGAVALTLTGPGEIIGENPFALSGGGGAIWIRAKQTPGTIRLEAKHPYLPAKSIRITTTPVTPEAL